MGVKTNIAGLTFTNADKTQAEALGLDIAGFMAGVQLECQELVDKLNFFISDVLTPTGDSANITAINAQITALS